MEKPHINIEFPELLPVSGQRLLIARAIQEHPVVIVCGETGSGKTTQLPKICLSIGRGRMNQTNRLIGHTQPRRIAATATAKRIAQELGTPLGQDVGFQVRFSDKTSSTASIKLMTDGILLAQTQNDPLLLAYDTIIIDEAHERSLNIDFLLGYLRQILPKRPDLKIIITSATIDATAFAKHFSTIDPHVPIIEVSGRLYPVEVRYRPIDTSLTKEGRESKDSKEQSEAIKDAILELWQSGVSGAGDILVFFPGEREIRECEQVLRKDLNLMQKYQPDILSLFARQSISEQERVFGHSAGRRIILSTNVAETSLTVPGIRFVIDTGLARVKRYSYRNKVEQLQIEPISQAASKQRAGRCGRVSDGICIRLYSEEDFLARPSQTDPEILRSSLAAVILRMASLKLSRIQDFPFLQPPLGRAISDGVQLLEELGAVESSESILGRTIELTPIGKELAKLPLDPKVSRMLIAARDNQALKEVLIIASALAIQDPRDRPLDHAQVADQAHQIFADPQSEFLSYIKIMAWYQNALSQKLSHRALDNLCKKQFISPRRMREWLDVYRQLQSLLSEQGWRENKIEATYEQIHLSLLTGLLGNIAKKSELEKIYDGTRGIKLNIWPGSNLSKKVGNWMVASELIETNRLYARTIAKIEPRWVEKICQHRLIKTWSDPFWDQRSGEIMAHEQGALYGLPLYNGRKVRFSLMQAAEARLLFIQRALVEGELFGSIEIAQIQKQSGNVFKFFWLNLQLIKQVEAIEHRSRRQDVLVDDLMIFEFYQKLLPQSVFSRSTLQAWLDKDQNNGASLLLTKADLMRHSADAITNDRYPKTMSMMGSNLSLSYHFEPGSPKDGVTLIIPIAILNQIDQRKCDWLVPGLCVEKVHLFLKTLPQKLRRQCVPLPEYAKQFIDRSLDKNEFGKGELIDAIIADIREITKVSIQRADFRPENLPPHCFMNYRLLDEHGRQLELERNLSLLQNRYMNEVREIFSKAAAQVVQQVIAPVGSPLSITKSEKLSLSNPHAPKTEQTITLPDSSQKITQWSFGELPEILEIQKNRQVLLGYPALEDHLTHCELNVYDDPVKARAIHLKGLRRLLSLAQKDSIKALMKQLPGARELGLLFLQIGTPEHLMQQIIDLALNRACLNEPLPKNQEEFLDRLQSGKTKLSLIAQEIARHVIAGLQNYHDVQKKISQVKMISPAAHTDISLQLGELIYPDFVMNTPYEQLIHLPRYLKGIAVRVEKLRGALVRDQENQNNFTQLQRQWLKIQQNQGFIATNQQQKIQEIRWQFEELRIALFAQELKTPVPMSIKRIEKILSSFQG